jgi:hypothetical protein
VKFHFHAHFVDSDKECCRLTFVDRNDESGKHYFIMDRMEASPEALPDMDNVYTEIDDQSGGGFSGLEHVVLERDALTIYNDSQTKVAVAGAGVCGSIRIGFALDEDKLRDLRDVLELIMSGYEAKMHLKL